MRLTRIEIENFKGISNRQSIELRPITLLFGPNSAGKSTILQALHYLREILERGNIDPDVTAAGGIIDLGGFATLVHNHELDRTVTLKVTLDLSDEQGVEGLPLNSGLLIRETEFEELDVRYLIDGRTEGEEDTIVQQVALAVDICWSELEQAPYVSRLAVETNGEPLAAIISSSPAGHALVTEFNFAHPLLLLAFPPEDEEMAASSPLEDEIRALTHKTVADRLAPDIPDSQPRIAVTTEKGALPALDGELILDIRESDRLDIPFEPDVPDDVIELIDSTYRVKGLRSLLSEMILGPARLVRNHLAQTTYIGPLREIPKRNYRPQVTPDEARWAHGLAAWDLLSTDRSGHLMDEVNHWLSGASRLHTGYRLARVESREIPVPGTMHQMFERGLNADDIARLQEQYLSLAIRTEIALLDSDKGILVAPGDVGVGISQMIPVVVAALREQDGILVIEQPELHVHPAIQVGLGDLFIHAASSDINKQDSGKTLIIETHSEHIMLRLLRRVREQTEDELPPETLGLVPDDLSVIYVERDVDGVRFRSLRVAKDGDFVDRWPEGFFEERAAELF